MYMYVTLHLYVCICMYIVYTQIHVYIIPFIYNIILLLMFLNSSFKQNQ